MAVAFLVFAGPLLAGALFFQFRAPGRAPGVYVEVDVLTSAGTTIYAVPGYPVDASAASMKAIVLPYGRIRSFFVVGLGPADTVTKPALTFFAVNHADEGFRPQSLPVAPIVRRVDESVYRVTAREFEPSGTAMPYYRQVLAHARGSRATIELVLGLAVTDSSGRRQMHAVRWPGQ